MRFCRLKNEIYFLFSFKIDLLRTENVRQGLELFRQILYDKTFLLAFIHVLEPTFALEDRIKFASYISICLFNNMPYYTE